MDYPGCAISILFLFCFSAAVQSVLSESTEKPQGWYQKYEDDIDLPPFADAGADVVTSLAHNSVTLYGNASRDDHGIVSYFWEWTSNGDLVLDAVGTRTPVLHLSNLEVGEYTFTLIVTDAAGQSSSATVHVLVKSAVTCPKPSIANGGVLSEAEEFYPGDRVSVMCDHGFEVRGPGTVIECTGVGEWLTTQGATPLPACIKDRCGDPPHLENGRFNVINGGPSAGSRAFYYCDQGYKFENERDSEKVCVSGTWEGEISACLEKRVTSCRKPVQIASGYYSVSGGGGRLVHGTDMKEGVQIHYRCLEGYRLTGGTGYRVCKQGQWSGQLPKCEDPSVHDCEMPPTIPNGGYNIFLPDQEAQEIEGMNGEGTQVQYFCHNGYQIVNMDVPVRIVCTHGRWEGSLPTCERKTHCKEPGDIPHGRWVIMSLDKEASKYIIGTKVLYECDVGFEAYGMDRIECEQMGYWSDHPPRCLAKSEVCSTPENIDNGDYICTPRSCGMYKVGVTVHYVCATGYLPSGNLLRACKTGGQWSGSTPRCYPGPGTLETRSSTRLHLSSSTLTIVVATSCSVLGLLLLVMVVVALQRYRSGWCQRATQPPAPPPYPAERRDSVEEHDRVALIAFSDGLQVVLPTYEEATRPRPGTPASRSLSGTSDSSSHYSGGGGGRFHHGDYRRLPSIPPSLRSHTDSIRSSGQVRDLPHDHGSHRNSTVTITSTSTRDNTSVSLPFGSIDTVNVSDGTSTSVTIETYDSNASNPSIATSQRATAGSLGSSNGSLATEDAPLLDQSSTNSAKLEVEEPSVSDDEKV